jgi:hypothetical protein
MIQVHAAHKRHNLDLKLQIGSKQSAKQYILLSGKQKRAGRAITKNRLWEKIVTKGKKYIL